PYPAKSKKDVANKAITDDFAAYTGQNLHLAGRLMSWREHGGVVFGDLQDASGRIQLYIKKETLQDTNKEGGYIGWDDLNLVDMGDYLQVFGEITRTERGEVSVLVEKLVILTKTIRPLPDKWHGMTDKEERFRRRYLDMTMDPSVRERMQRRAKF